MAAEAGCSGGGSSEQWAGQQCCGAVVAVEALEDRGIEQGRMGQKASSSSSEFIAIPDTPNVYKEEDSWFTVEVVEDPTGSLPGKLQLVLTPSGVQLRSRNGRELYRSMSYYVISGWFMEGDLGACIVLCSGGGCY